MTDIKRLSAAFLAAAILLTLGCAGSRTQESTGELIDDSVITTKVKAAFVNDPVVKASEVSVSTFKGTVHLSGDVASRRALDQAVQLARNVPGVKSVRNELRVR